MGTGGAGGGAGGGNAGAGPRRALAPLHQLQRNHPYRRSAMDDRALRLLGPGPVSEARATSVVPHI